MANGVNLSAPVMKAAHHGRESQKEEILLRPWPTQKRRHTLKSCPESARGILNVRTHTWFSRKKEEIWVCHSIFRLGNRSECAWVKWAPLLSKWARGEATLETVWYVLFARTHGKDGALKSETKKDFWEILSKKQLNFKNGAVLFRSICENKRFGSDSKFHSRLKNHGRYPQTQRRKRKSRDD